MKKEIFIHSPLFRIFTPLLLGIMTYLFIILFNNEVAQVGQLFESQELYVCIFTAFAIMELDRWLLLYLDMVTQQVIEWKRLIVMLLVCSLSAVLLSSIILVVYFYFFVGFAPSKVDLLIFTISFWALAELHFTLFLGQMLLHKENTLKLSNIQHSKDSLESEFNDFRSDINPTLLFSSLEHLITLAHHRPSQADDLIDHLSIVYRYLLAHRQAELVKLEDEIAVIRVLIELFNLLPQYHVTFSVSDCHSDIQVVPTMLLSTVERIVKRTICSDDDPVNISLNYEDDYLVISYISNDRLLFSDREIISQKSQRTYGFFTDKPLVEVLTDDESYVKIPILKLEGVRHFT